MTNSERKVLAVVLAAAALAAVVLTVLYSADLIEGAVPILVMAAIAVPAAVYYVRRSR